MPLMANASDMYNFALNPMSPANMLNPLNPYNAINPASPYYSMHHNNQKRIYEDYEYSKYMSYEICCKNKCMQTTSHKVAHKVIKCLRHEGGSACLNKFSK